MLGVQVNKCRMFPHEEHMKEEILAVFNVGEGDMFKRSAFERAWEESLKTKVKVAIINRRGRFASYARLELWRLLGVPKPRNGNSIEIESWKDSLKPLFRHNNWRWKDGDPFGSDAFFGAIACIMSGKNYSTRTPISMLPNQLAWFAYVLGLAMDGDRNMKETELRFHQEGIQGYIHFILERRDSIRRINVIHATEDNLEATLGTDVGCDSSSDEEGLS
ncbi:hypothetical protein M758_UG239200 [Ceratodon purpureus]|nr:hypothetical protein M758_UG239200 [Ceratodon purpureus]